MFHLGLDFGDMESEINGALDEDILNNLFSSELISVPGDANAEVTISQRFDIKTQDLKPSVTECKENLPMISISTPQTNPAVNQEWNKENLPKIAVSTPQTNTAVNHVPTMAADKEATARPADDIPDDLRCKRFVLVPVLFTFVFALGLALYWLPQYVKHVIEQAEPIPPGNQSTGNGSGSHYVYDPCTDSESDPRYKRYLEIQLKTARWTMFVSIAAYVPAIFTNILWGTLSDRYGRKLTLSICGAGQSIKYILITIVVYYNLDVTYIILASFIDGCTGTFTSLLAVCFSYVSDLTEAGKQRTLFIVLIEVFMAVAFTISSFVSGYFIETTGFFYPVLAVSCFLVFGLVIVLIFLPETVHANTRACAKQKTIFSTLSSAGKFYMNQESRVKQLEYIFLILSFAIYAIPYMSSTTVETIYELGAPFCWKPSTVGIFAGLNAGLGSLLAVLGAYILQKCCADDTVAVIGVVARIIASVVQGLARTTAVLFTLPVIGALGILPMAMIRSLMSQLTDAKNQGALFASIAAVETLCTLIGSLTSNLVYSATVAIFNGFVFILGALITVVGLVFLLCFMYVRRREQRREGNTVKPI